MNIDTSMGMMPPQNQGMNSGERPKGPPPQGSIPPGLEGPVSTFSTSEQEDVKSMLESFSSEQHEQLKAKLDELKPSAQTMSTEEIGATFLEFLNEISGNQYHSSNNSTTSTIDTYV